MKEEIKDFVIIMFVVICFFLLVAFGTVTTFHFLDIYTEWLEELSNG